MSKQIIALAKNLITKYKTRNPFEIAELLGMLVIPFPFKKINGLIVTVDETTIVGVNSSLPANLQKSILFHEIGHFLWHPRDVGHFFIIEKTLYVQKWEYEATLFGAEMVIREERPHHGETIEQFAARLELPAKLVRLWWQSKLSRGA